MRTRRSSWTSGAAGPSGELGAEADPQTRKALDEFADRGVPVSLQGRSGDKKLRLLGRLNAGQLESDPEAQRLFSALTGSEFASGGTQDKPAPSAAAQLQKAAEALGEQARTEEATKTQEQKDRETALKDRERELTTLEQILTAIKDGKDVDVTINVQPKDALQVLGVEKSRNA